MKQDPSTSSSYQFDQFSKYAAPICLWVSIGILFIFLVLQVFVVSQLPPEIIYTWVGRFTSDSSELTKQKLTILSLSIAAIFILIQVVAYGIRKRNKQASLVVRILINMLALWQLANFTASTTTAYNASHVSSPIASYGSFDPFLGLQAGFVIAGIVVMLIVPQVIIVLKK